MDMQIIGRFLTQLRKDWGLTQEQLGLKLGVSNKTVSRWETGTYLPPVEMLQSLSQMYGLTINEILSGDRLDEKQYREKAEENIKATLKASAFTLKEKIAFFKRKWLLEHRFGLIVEALVFLGLLVCGFWMDDLLLLSLVNVGFFWRIAARRNDMRVYIEERAFDGSGNQ